MKIFGTDGIRSLAGEYPLNIEFLMQLVPALIKTFPNISKILLARDTRLSGPMISYCLAGIFSNYGIDILDAGVMPTPSLPSLIKSTNSSLGIMISASHNPFEDNGIKIFNQNGFKLTIEQETIIESHLLDSTVLKRSTHKNIGNIFQQNLEEQYISFIDNQFKNMDLSKFRITVDSANGAMSQIASKVLKKFGATVYEISNTPNGTNINDKCGVMHPENISNFTKKQKADLGLAFDGDGDRLAICDENGEIINGDHLIGFLASKSEYINSVAITIMSNLGLENFLKKLGKAVIRTPVGDKFIASKIVNNEAQFGGEPSGHIILGKYSNTGDGLIAALETLNCLLKVQQPISKSIRQFKLLPFVQKNIKVNDKNIADSIEIKNLVNKYLTPNIRIVLRKSGTENLIRILVEGENYSEISNILEKLENELFDINNRILSDKING